MNGLTRPQRDMLGLICDNYRRGVALAARTRLAPQASRIVNNLRRHGLVEPASYRPSRAALELPARQGRRQGLRNGRRTAWTEAVKECFLLALEEGETIAMALQAAGFSIESRAGAFKIKRDDPKFARRWEAALAKAGRSRTKPVSALTAPAVAMPPSVPATRAPVDSRAIAARPSTETPPSAQAPRPRISDAAIAAAALAHQSEQKRIAELRPPMSVDEAKLILQRKGRVVYRASVDGGPADRWRVSGFAEPIDDAMLKHEAERLQERDGK